MSIGEASVQRSGKGLDVRFSKQIAVPAWYGMDLEFT